MFGEQSVLRKIYRLPGGTNGTPATFSSSGHLGKPTPHWGQDGPPWTTRTPTPAPPRTPAGASGHRTTRWSESPLHSGRAHSPTSDVTFLTLRRDDSGPSEGVRAAAYTQGLRVRGNVGGASPRRGSMAKPGCPPGSHG